MNERVHRALDGELAREDLTSAERAEAAAVDAAASSLRGHLSAPAPADMHEVVMRRIHELYLEPLPDTPVTLVRRAARVLVAQQDIRLRLRPVYGLAVAAMLLLLLVWRPGAAPVALPPVSSAASTVYVQFHFEGDAREVALAGTFTGWQPAHALRETAPGVWTTVLSVEPGVHDYVFIVDGVQHVPDPYAPRIADGFGGYSSRLTVLPPSREL